MSKFTPHIATLEIPVTTIQRSVDWYTDIFGLKVHFKDNKSAMLIFESKGVPTIYLVETEEQHSLSFRNTNTEIVHSVIDFYTPSLVDFHGWLKDNNIEVGTLNIDPNHGFGGFSFKDPDGNQLGATNILQPGQ
ncbi:VOC family protein [Bacillus sp. JJ722]|uniref:VOC family protein n=1 Tax=Bacillus sp. JJ722 TaxID=3122973 RepID=UPI002FFDCB71